MSTGIDLNSAIAQASITSALLDQQAAEANASSQARLAPILGGASLTISAAANGDLQALLEKLKGEQERTKMSLLISSLKAISESLTDSQRAALEKGIELSEQLDTLQKELSGLQGTVATANAESIALAVKISSLEEQIKIAQQEGKDHLEQEAELKKLREDKAAKDKIIADTQGKINDVANKVSNVKAQLSIALGGVGENALKTIASELLTLMGPEKAETNAEQEKRAQKEEEVNPFSAIRDSLDKFRQEFYDAIESNTEHMV